MHNLTLKVGFSCSSGPDGGFLSDPVAPFLEETIEVPMWVGSFSLSLDRVLLTSSMSSPGCSHQGLSWLPLMGFDFAGLVVWLLLASRSLTPPSRSTPFARFVTFWRLCDASWGHPWFPHSLWCFFASYLAALPFASLPLVSRPFTVLSWSPLLSLSSVSDCLVVVPHQLVGLR